MIKAPTKNTLLAAVTFIFGMPAPAMAQPVSHQTATPTMTAAPQPVEQVAPAPARRKEASLTAAPQPAAEVARPHTIHAEPTRFEPITVTPQRKQPNITAAPQTPAQVIPVRRPASKNRATTYQAAPSSSTTIHGSGAGSAQ